MTNQWIGPMTGVAFIVAFIVAMVVSGTPPAIDEPAREIVNHYTDNEDSISTGALLQTLAAMFLVFFGGHLRKTLSEAEGPGGVLPAVALSGTAVMAFGIALDATLALAMAEAADDVPPAAVQALHGLFESDWLPVILGTELVLFGAGISTLLHGGLPRWLGFAAVALALVGLTPVGFVALGGGALWILVVSVLLALRARRDERTLTDGRRRTGDPAGRTAAASSHAGV